MCVCVGVLLCFYGADHGLLLDLGGGYTGVCFSLHWIFNFQIIVHKELRSILVSASQDEDK